MDETSFNAMVMNSKDNFAPLMGIHDIENGQAFRKDYEWPEVNKMKRKEF